MKRPLRKKKNKKNVVPFIFVDLSLTVVIPSWKKGETEAIFWRPGV